MNSNYKRVFKFKIGSLTEIELSYSENRPMQLKLYAPGGLTYFNLFFGKFLLCCHKSPF